MTAEDRAEFEHNRRCETPDCCNCTDERYCDYCRVRDAAPDMLAALEMIESCLSPDDNDEAAKAVRAAIRKATQA